MAVTRHQVPVRSQPRFNKIKPETLEFEFIFDNTGALPDTDDPGRNEGIIPDLEHFKEVVIGYRGELHRPPYLLLSWGTLLFKGVILEMTVNFKLFNPNGTPIRAVAKAKFEGFVEDDLRVRMEDDQSPDLTHVRIVKQGDTLPLMSKSIYGDPRHYLEVARINKLVNFRNLRVGQRILFPPLEKN